jgi:ABC-type sugar transport system substrate-binding protein
MGGKGNLVILIGELSDEPAHGRTDGIKQVVKEQFLIAVSPCEAQRKLT